MQQKQLSASDLIDPVQFMGLCWPDVHIYDKQRQICYSVRDNDETIVPAGNGLGKDFISGLISLWFFCSRRPAKVVTTSVKADQLNDVLWGEIRRFIETSKYTLPIQFNHLKIRQLRPDGTLVGNAELVGQVINQGEALLGRHLPKLPGNVPTTLCVFDECSGVEDKVYESSDTWAHRKLIIGNPYPCNNFFRRGSRDGDLLKSDGKTYYRKVIRITCEDSPNVQLARAQIAAGQLPTNEVLVPGVIDYETVVKRRMLWDPVRQCIGLDAQFYEGASVLMFPPLWLNNAEQLAASYVLKQVARKGKWMGVDSAEGGDKTAWCIIDEYGIVELISMKTPDTNVVYKQTLFLMKKHGIEPGNVAFDRGGGGKEHADRLRAENYRVRTVGFGEPASDVRKYEYGMKSKDHRIDVDETRYEFKNRRAEMYWNVRLLLDPVQSPKFGIGSEFKEIRDQLGPIPFLLEGEGRIYLPPKYKKNKDSKEVTLTELIGHSPDETDALVLAVFAMLNKSTKKVLGKAF